MYDFCHHRLQKFCFIPTSALSGSLCTSTTWNTPCTFNHFFPNECNFWSNNRTKVIIFALICFVTCLTHLAKPILHGGATFNPGPNILSQTIQGGSLDLISKSWYWLLFSLSCFSRRSRLPNNEAQNHYTTGLFPADSVEKLSTLRRPYFSYELHILKSGRVLFTHWV